MNTLRTSATRTVLLLAALVATLALAPSPASAGQAVKGGFYDGGDGLTIQVAASGKKIKRTYINFSTNCNDSRGGGGAVGIPDGLRIRNGRFAFRMFKRFPATGGTEKVNFSGKFSADGLRVVAKFRQKLTNPAAGYNCDTGTLKMAASTKLIQPSQIGPYKGITSQNRVVRLEVDDAGKGAIRGFYTEVEVSCPRGRDKNITVGFTAAKLDGGAFTETNSDFADRAKTTFSGRLAGSKVSGKIVVNAQERYYDDESGDYFNLDCTPAELTFTASKGG